MLRVQTQLAQWLWGTGTAYPIRLEDVIYNGGHRGDWIPVEDVPALKSPVGALASHLAALTRELVEGGQGSFVYEMLGTRLAGVKQHKDASDKAAEDRLRELEAIALDATRVREEPAKYRLSGAGEYDLFTVLRSFAPEAEISYVADCARRMVAHLRSKHLLAPGWSQSKGARMQVEQTLLVESWQPDYVVLGFDANSPDPPFLKPAVDELAKSDRQG
ncbi:MAG: hypothetical protein ACLQVD_11450 [Capsulimonadaceae bacterium]